ncbi:MAG TPA: prepilin-type N-terminal cleavage/methylation domain-containing protein [Tepidisphaeraceae bacterium]|nr:prepilin-type N-terminal cleavage/methylation domain-containing protein [Tepidisphaeraceae bacterium]
MPIRVIRGLYSPRRGFTLIELATTVAALVIVMGLMVSLARYVRNASAVELTKKLLLALDQFSAEYSAHHGGAVLNVPALIPVGAWGAQPGVPKGIDEAMLEKNALANNQAFIMALRSEAGFNSSAVSGVPKSIYDDNTLRDAWGTPLVYMPAMNPAIGMAPQNKPFFFSAGPDRKFLTQEDNLYSYEVGKNGE